MEVFFKTHLFWRCLNTSGGVLRRHEGDPPMGALPPPPLLLPLLSFPLLPPPLPSHRLLLHFAGLLSLPSLEILPLYGGRSLSSYSHNPSPSGPPVNKYFERGCSPHLLPYSIAVLSGKTSGGAGEKGRCRCPGCCSPHLLPYSIAVLSGKTSGGAGEKGRCRCPGCIIARNKVDDFTRQMGRCRSVPTCVEKSWGGTGDEGSRGRPVGGRGPGTMLVA